MLAWFRCLIRSHHDPIRHPLGGFQCAECGAVGAHLGEMGFASEAYLRADRSDRFREGGAN